MIIDTHAHLYSDQFNEDLHDVIAKANIYTVEKLILPNIDASTIAPLKKIWHTNPEFFIPMMGLHPTSVKQDYKSQLDIIYRELNQNDAFVAVGEIGIDLFWDTTFLKEQTDAFETQLDWSIEKDLPVAIHSRNSYQEIIHSLYKIGEDKLRGVFHSFCGNDNDLKQLLQFNNFYFGINGVVTFKNSTLLKVLKNCPIERIVLETDSPYLTPAPFRGKRNEPKYLKYIIEALSTIYGLGNAEIAHITKTNSFQLFGLNN